MKKALIVIISIMLVFLSVACISLLLSLQPSDCFAFKEKEFLERLKPNYSSITETEKDGLEKNQTCYLLCNENKTYGFGEMVIECGRGGYVKAIILYYPEYTTLCTQAASIASMIEGDTVPFQALLETGGYLSKKILVMSKNNGFGQCAAVIIQS